MRVIYKGDMLPRHMASTVLNPVSLEEFSRLPYVEESPAWELMNGQVLQKPATTLHHSLLQKPLVNAIDQDDSPFEAFPELRCIFSRNSVVSDVAIIRQNRMPKGNQPLQGAPD